MLDLSRCIQILDIQIMPIHIIQEDAFCGLTNLRTLQLTHCQILQMPPLNPVKRVLKRLTLSQNKIMLIPDGYFYGFVRLRSLNLAHNSLSSVSQLHPLSATLRFLYLYSNKLQYFPTSDHNTTYTALYRLHLSYNNITEFTKDTLHNFPALSMIQLEVNLISHIEDLRGLRRLARLTVRDVLLWSYNEKHVNFSLRSDTLPSSKLVVNIFRWVRLQ